MIGQLFAEPTTCRAYEAKVNQLTEDMKRNLKHQGVAVVLNEILLDELTVPACAERARISEYLSNRVKGKAKSAEERRLAQEHGEAIGKVICKIWSDIDRHGVGDGAFYAEKFNILADRELPEGSIEPLIVRLLRAPISQELAFVLLTRRSAIYKNYLETSQTTGGITSRILRIACLAQIEPDQTRLATLLGKLRENNALSPSQLRVCNRLIDKIRRGGEISYSDVDDLQTDQ
jgi:hypothetical protein